VGAVVQDFHIFSSRGTMEKRLKQARETLETASLSSIGNENSILKEIETLLIAKPLQTKMTWKMRFANIAKALPWFSTRVRASTLIAVNQVKMKEAPAVWLGETYLALYAVEKELLIAHQTLGPEVPLLPPLDAEGQIGKRLSESLNYADASTREIFQKLGDSFVSEELFDLYQFAWKNGGSLKVAMELGRFAPSGRLSKQVAVAKGKLAFIVEGREMASTPFQVEFVTSAQSLDAMLEDVAFRKSLAPNLSLACLKLHTQAMESCDGLLSLRR
jgi:hypothetical protein